MDRVAVSGIGIVSPGGSVVEAFLRTLSSDRGKDPTWRVPDFALEQSLGQRAIVPPSRRRDQVRPGQYGAGRHRRRIPCRRLRGRASGSRRRDQPRRGDLRRGVSPDPLAGRGPRGVAPHFSESVPNAPAGNGAIAFQIRGPVHTLFGDETVGTQAIDLASNLLYDGCVDRCLVAGTEEWNEVVAHAYAQMDQVHRNGGDHGDTPALSDGAAALVLELESTVARRKATPHAVIGGWHLGRCLDGLARGRDGGYHPRGVRTHWASCRGGGSSSCLPPVGTVVPRCAAWLRRAGTQRDRRRGSTSFPSWAIPWGPPICSRSLSRRP